MNNLLDKLTEAKDGKFPQVQITFSNHSNIVTVVLADGLYHVYTGTKSDPYQKTVYESDVIRFIPRRIGREYPLTTMKTATFFDESKKEVTNKWNPTKNGNGNFKNAVSANRNNGNRVGGESSFGTVTKIGGKFVKKTMKFNQSSDQKIFLNEIRVGSTPGIKKVGPKIYAWRIQHNSSGKALSGEYIMDDFRIAPRGYKVVSFDDYVSLPLLVLKGGVKTRLVNAPRRLKNFFYLKLRYYLTEFWRITKGYHGDLHFGNIAVMYKESTGKVQRFVIFDYGAHKRFKTPIHRLTTFEQLTNIINKEFKNRYMKTTGQNNKSTYPHTGNEYFPPGSRVRLSRGRQGQPRRPNTNMLRTFTYTHVIAPGHNLMSKMTFQNNYKKRLAKVPDWDRNQTLPYIKRRKAPEHLFVTSPNYNNAVEEAKKRMGS
jgi:hypothetical protein